MSALTCDGELGAGDVWSTHHPVVPLVGRLTFFDLEQVAVANDADVVFVVCVQLLRALVPRQRDLWVVDLYLALKYCLFVGEDGLVGDVLHYGDRLQAQQDSYSMVKMFKTTITFSN